MARVDDSGGKKGMGREAGPDGVTGMDVNPGKRASVERWAGVGRTLGDTAASAGRRMRWNPVPEADLKHRISNDSSTARAAIGRTAR